MPTIVIAPDKFKGSISSIEFCHAVEKGIKKQLPEAKIIKLPLADGGDGTIEVLNYYLQGEKVWVSAHNPVMKKRKASYLYSQSRQTAYIEMAGASGIRLLKRDEFNPMETTTYGTGELIVDALNRGARHIILGIGGSATNDAGLGMARALGFQLQDAHHNSLTGRGKDLQRLRFIDASGVHPRLHKVVFEVACDVDNPLYGPHGAALIYAPQKGASPEMVEHLDAGLRNFNEVAKASFNQDLPNIAGAGAAGGLGAGAILFLNARLTAGIELIKKEARFDQNIKNAAWIITGEGRLDDQTLSGKVIKGVINSITDQRLAVFCGINRLNNKTLTHLNIGYLKETMAYATNLDDSIQNAASYLERAAQVFAKAKLKV